MFNLLVKGSGWSENRDSMSLSRILEYTESHLVAKFCPGGVPDMTALRALPTLFLEESHRDGQQLARVGTIISARTSGRDVVLEYAYDSDVVPILNEDLESFASELDIDDFEFHRTHWAVKEVDLFRVLFRKLKARGHKPKVFTLREPENIEPVLVSAMMPFHPSFDAVYETLKASCETTGFRCRRADDIWENPAIIQDVVSLIDRSSVVICDCSGKNANVFYEAGIAHTLGREVILITQSEADIPFDLRHLRYVQYLNNVEGRAELAQKLEARLATLAEERG